MKHNQKLDNFVARSNITQHHIKIIKSIIKGCLFITPVVIYFIYSCCTGNTISIYTSNEFWEAGVIVLVIKLIYFWVIGFTYDYTMGLFMDKDLGVNKFYGYVFNYNKIIFLSVLTITLPLLSFILLLRLVMVVYRKLKFKIKGF